MDTKKLNRSGKISKNINSNNRELQDGCFLKAGLQTNSFVNQSKENFKNFDSVGSLQTLKRKGWLFEILFMKILKTITVNIIIRSN